MSVIRPLFLRQSNSRLYIIFWFCSIPKNITNPPRFVNDREACYNSFRLQT